MFHKPPLALLTLLCLAGCGQPPSQKAEAEQQTLRSWAATAGMVGDAWKRRAVPDAYARQTLQAARQALGDTKGRGDLHPLEDTLDQMAAAVRRGDRDGIAPGIARLGEEEKELRGARP